VLVVLTCRPECSLPWSRREYVTEIRLGRLGRSPSTQIATAAAGGMPLPPQLLDQILQRADGVPLFIEELSKMVRESGLLREVDGRLELAGSLPPIGIPMTLRDSLMARLDRLGGAKSVIQIAAVVGREFPYLLLRAVSDVDDEELVAALGQLVDADLLFQSGLPPRSRYAFKHALIQEAASELLLRSTRQELHRRVADVLVERFPDLSENQPELVAHHYTEGDRVELSLDYRRRAGERALANAANDDASVSRVGRENWSRGVAHTDDLYALR
jgi:predicted ATPase